MPKDCDNSLLYQEREEWKDVTPVPQDDGPHPIVSISYSPKFRSAYDYFRAILKSGEKSDRALALTEDCILLNPANYTVWKYRRDILRALDKDLHEELKFTSSVIQNNLKNYQAWHHRTVIVDLLQDPTGELEFTKNMLKLDEKNYHVWQYRQWFIKKFNLFDDELEYVEELLDQDVRNNSAWNQRYFVLNNTTDFKQNVIDREIDYTLSQIHLVTGNESAWSYLRSIVKKDIGGLGNNRKVREACENLYNQDYRTNHLLACIIDICDERSLADETPDSIFHISNALKLCTDLAEKHDIIRRKYWYFVAERLERKLKPQSARCSVS